MLTIRAPDLISGTPVLLFCINHTSSLSQARHPSSFPLFQLFLLFLSPSFPHATHPRSLANLLLTDHAFITSLLFAVHPIHTDAVSQFTFIAMSLPSSLIPAPALASRSFPPTLPFTLRREKERKREKVHVLSCCCRRW